jgi:hypothetical protein
VNISRKTMVFLRSVVFSMNPSDLTSTTFSSHHEVEL